MSLSIVFMGTPEFAVPSLAEIIANGYNVKRVYTQPARKSGRGKKITKSPVHQFAEIMGIPVETPEKFDDPEIIKELENLALSYDGVGSAYAIQAGRELRVLVEAEKVSDQRAEELSFTISQRIQTEMTYPGQVKVTVIREKRAVNYAK